MKNPVDFTPKITVTNVPYNYKIDKPVIANEWLGDGTNQNNIILNQFKRFASYNLLGDKVACDPIIIDGWGSNMYILDQSSSIYKVACDPKPKIMWKYKLLQGKGQRYSGGGIVYSDNKLYITNGSRYLFVISAETGDYGIEKKLPDIIMAKPLVDKNMIYLQDINNNVYALNQINGDIIWHNKDNFGEMLVNQYSRQLWLSEDRIISLSSNGILSALNKTNGHRLWQIEIFDSKINYEHVLIKDFSNKGCLVNNNIYISNNDGYLYKIDINNGKVIYRLKIANVQTISKNGNLIIATTSANQLIAIDPETGKLIWSADLFDSKVTNIALIQTPQIFNGLLYVITNKKNIVLLEPETGKINSSIRIGNGASYYASVYGKLYIFSGKSVKISE